MVVARVRQVIGASRHSWQEAVRRITVMEVLRDNAAVENGRIRECRAMVQVSFIPER